MLSVIVVLRVTVASKNPRKFRKLWFQAKSLYISQCSQKVAKPTNSSKLKGMIFIVGSFCLGCFVTAHNKQIIMISNIGSSWNRIRWGLLRLMLVYIHSVQVSHQQIRVEEIFSKLMDFPPESWNDSLTRRSYDSNNLL